MKNLMKEILTINSSETLNSVFKNSHYKLQKYSERNTLFIRKCAFIQGAYITDRQIDTS